MGLRRVIDDALIPHAAFEAATRQVEQCLKYAQGSAEPICLALLGESRTGKSRVLEECEAKRPRIRTKEGLEVPVLRVKVPSNPTVKGLAEVLLQAMEDPKWDVGTENAKTMRLCKLMRECKTLMVIADEFQHFVDRKSQSVFHHVTDWLKMLVDEAKVALVVAGLPGSDAVLLQNAQLAGRFLAPMYMPRFDWMVGDQREQFLGILRAFDAEMRSHFDLPLLDSDAMGFRLWCASGGLMGYLTRLLRQLVWDALDAGSKKMDLGSFELAYRVAIWADSGVPMEARPFAATFDLTPAPELLVRVGQIGVDRQPEDLPRNRASLRRRQSLAQVLKTSGE